MSQLIFTQAHGSWGPQRRKTALQAPGRWELEQSGCTPEAQSSCCSAFAVAWEQCLFFTALHS